jgi:hypothetical protein
LPEQAASGGRPTHRSSEPLPSIEALTV